LEPVISITPCLRLSREETTANVVAACDSHGTVDLWDLRTKQTQGWHRLGDDWPAVGRAPVMSQATPGCNIMACCQPPAGGNQASICLADLLTGQQRGTLPLPAGLQPCAMGFAPSPCALGVLAQEEVEETIDAGAGGPSEGPEALHQCKSRLLLFAGRRRPR